MMEQWNDGSEEAMTGHGEMRGRSVLTLGLGRSGAAAAALLRASGAAVTLLDHVRDVRTLGAARTLRRQGVRVGLGPRRLSRAWLQNGGRQRRRAAEAPIDLCVVSPGIPPDSPWLAAVAAAGIPIESELELGARLCPCPLLAITGSNGKSTATRLCADALTLAGKKALEAGNCGYPLCAAVLEHPELEYAVVEVSSFQLERVHTLRPQVGALLNIQPDHLDRHGSMERYFETKLRLFARMGAGDTAIAPAADLADIRARVTRVNAQAANMRWIGFGSAAADYRVEKGWSVRTPQGCIALRDTPFDNPVMAATVAAVAAVLAAVGVPEATLRTAAERFAPLPHRFQTVLEIGGVRFVDDSKATNLAALQAALQMTTRPIRLVAGGRLKEKNLDDIKESLAKRVKKIYCIGESGLALASAWGDAVACVPCGELAAAVHAAWREARVGETVLLAPGCASFDQFNNFGERGDVFAETVRSIAHENRKGVRQ
jgi:UDP-N-acetylmuramoylalanine--D-glutamate ligase